MGWRDVGRGRAARPARGKLPGSQGPPRTPAKGTNTIAWDGKAAKPGTYTAELTVSSSDGQQATDTAQVQVKKKNKKKK